MTLWQSEGRCPAAILNKPGKLTDEEFAVIRQHPSTGARILSPIGVYRDTIPIVLSHHERLDAVAIPRGSRGIRFRCWRGWPPWPTSTMP